MKKYPVARPSWPRIFFCPMRQKRPGLEWSDQIQQQFVRIPAGRPCNQGSGAARHYRQKLRIILVKDAEKREGKNKLILFPFLGDCGIITISAKVLRTTKGRPVVVCLMTDDNPGYPPDCSDAARGAENLPKGGDTHASKTMDFWLGRLCDVGNYDAGTGDGGRNQQRARRTCDMAAGI